MYRPVVIMYTPVVIHFKPAVLSVNDESMIPDAEVQIRIKTPEQVSPGVVQSIPRIATLTIPNSGIFKCKLLRSDFYRNRGFYEIEYLFKGAERPFFKETWVVPPPASVQRVTFFSGNDPNSILILPTDFFSILNPNNLPKYYIESNSINFEVPLTPNIQYSYSYLPGITRAELIKQA